MQVRSKNTTSGCISLYCYLVLSFYTYFSWTQFVVILAHHDKTFSNKFCGIVNRSNLDIPKIKFLDWHGYRETLWISSVNIPQSTFVIQKRRSNRPREAKTRVYGSLCYRNSPHQWGTCPLRLQSTKMHDFWFFSVTVLLWDANIHFPVSTMTPSQSVL